MFAGTIDGTPFHAEGHVKVVSFKNCIKMLCGRDKTKKIQSVFRVDLPKTVEAQFSEIDVPADMATVRHTIEGQESCCLLLEMMCVRSNCNSTAKEIKDFMLDFDNLMIWNGTGGGNCTVIAHWLGCG